MSGLLRFPVAVRTFLILAIASLSAVPAPANAGDRVLVFAAASLRNALDEIGAAWGEKTGATLVVSYAGSSALARQIEQGAPADLFVSANLDWMDYLSERGLTDAASERELLSNRLVLIAPKDSEVELAIAPGVDLLAALGDDGRLAMANTDVVPAGRYGKAALQSLKAWDAVEPRVAQAENVRAALALVSIGEAPLGIVYQTDAAADADVRVVGLFPEETHPPIVYAAALMAGVDKDEARAFLAFLRSPAASAIFADHGFVPLAVATTD
ncbi:molybdate ABC transporter substrate-binding protein [Nitratireductor sp. CAU 1489]|uniref:Molybdate ABC transporter substrate-binding protein n=1 Tax=Nitratireductor arenosus TaxID=2682096 RepID=A0A844QBT2_9HYPH|nr:molybdate ABC transporter substrate-binding protein [Nitratireductor arenosus]MVA96715.1 molybdate ABC transporter substrate-binding protein [Nitratireductor arenosus]